MRDERRAFWIGILLALLLARALRALLSTAFYGSLTTLRLNESAGWTAVLLAPALAALLPRRALPLALGVAGAASALLPITRFTESYLPLSAFASAACLVALPLLARHSGGFQGALVGLAIEAAILTAADSFDPLGPFWAALAAVAATTIAIGLARTLTAPARGDGALASDRDTWTARRASLVGGVAIGALLALEIAYLASPFAIARWLGIPAWAAALASLAGLAAGAMLGGRFPLWILAGLSILDVALLLSPIRALSLAVLQAALGAAGARLAPALGARTGSAAAAATLSPLLFTLLFFRSPLGVSEWAIIVPALALVALFAALPRARAPRLPSPVAALALATLALAAAIPTPVDDAPPTRELTIVTWNTHQGFGNRGALDPAIYLDALRALDADIILLQETDTARLSSGGLDLVRYLADGLPMRAAYGRGGPAILTRLPFADVPTRDREWLFEAAVDVNGTTVWVESVHLGRSTRLRAEQAAELVVTPGSPRIVAGDFNLFERFAPGRTGDPYATLTTRYDDAWIETGHAPEDPDGRTFRLPDPFIRIDLILVDGVDVLTAQRVLTPTTRLASDHLPVVARVRV